MVDVTSESFASLLPVMRHELQEAVMVSLDAEFTSFIPEDNSNEFFDDGEERYRKLCQNFKSSSINQLGLSIFKADKYTGKFSVSVYNIYVKPPSFLDTDSSFVCMASSLAFLLQHNFDFNKWLRYGVPCLNNEESEALRASLDSLEADNTSIIRPSFQVRDKLEAIMKWSVNAAVDSEYILRKSLPGNTQLMTLSPDGVRMPVPSKEVTQDNQPRPLPNDPSFLPLLLSTLLHSHTDVILSRLSPDEVVLLKSSDREACLAHNRALWAELKEKWCAEQAGCSVLLHDIARLKIPLVLHNGLIDMLLIYKQFFGKLPITFNRFKKLVRQEFPVVYDTKFLCQRIKKHHKSIEEVQNCLYWSGLQQLYISLRTNEMVLFSPTVTVKPPNKYANECRLHEAGYDSYLTGCCFLLLSHLHYSLALPQNVSYRRLEPREYFSAVKAFVNFLHISRAAISCVNLYGDDPVTLRPPWIIIEKLNKSDGIEIEVLPSYGDDQDCNNQNHILPKSSITLRKFTASSLASVLSQYGAVDVRPWRSNKLLVAPSSYYTHRFLLTRLRTTDLKFYQYSVFRHSMVARTALWTTMITSGSLSMYLFFTAIQ